MTAPGERLSDTDITPKEQFRALFENMGEGVALHELVCDEAGQPQDYRILDVNQQFEQQTGLRRSDVTGRLASEAYGAGVPPYLEEYSSVALGGPPLRIETYFAPLDRHLVISVAALGRGVFATIFSDVTPIKRQAEALEKIRLAQRAVIDNQPQLTWLKDRAGRFLVVNQAFAQACGQPSPEAMVGKTDLDVWPTALAQGYRADDELVMSAGEQRIVEERIESTLGTRWVETYKSPVYGPDGNIIGTTGIARDITEQKRALEAMRQSEHKFEQVFDLAPNPIAVTQLSGELLYVNRAFCKATGYSRNEIIGRRTEELDIWEDPASRAEAMQRLQRDGRFSTEATLITKNGVRRCMEVSGELIELDDKKVMITAARDVTERQLAERAAARSREQLLNIAELAHIGYFTYDVENKVQVWTPEYYRILGLDPEKVQPTPEAARERIHPGDRERVIAAVNEAESGRSGIRLHFRVIRPTGELRYCLATIERDHDERGRPVVMGQLQDLTELRRAEEDRRKLEQQVMQSQKLESLGVLAGGIAHDFNNLLTSILGNADLALRELPPASSVCSYLEDIEKVSRRAAELCRQMLAYSGKGRFVVQAISLNDVVREMAHLLSVSISKKAVIKYNFFSGLPSVMADATQLRQVVMNLITNASDAVAEVSGVITLSTGVMDCDEAYLCSAMGYSEVQRPGQYVYLEVSDTGCGIEAENLSRIFDPFFTTKFTGRGLGLAAVLGIVRGHGGALSVHSEPARGTSFKVLLPAHHEPALTVGAADPDTDKWKGHGLVLLADDEESIRSMGRCMLERFGFQVVLAVDGRDAVEQFTKHRDAIRLVVLDMTMPHLDGEACFGELRRIDPNVKVIMTSGYNEPEVIARFVGKGLAAFVQKPYNISDLLPAVARVLGDS